MIVTKKLWLDWDYEDDTPCDTLGWTDKKPKRHNGIIEKGTEIVLFSNQHVGREDDSQFITFREVVETEDDDYPEFTMEEFFRFIKDGTFQLKDGK